MIPQCGEPEFGHGSGNSRRGYSQRILVRIVLGGLSGTSFELFGSGLIISMDESTPARIERFGEFEILWMWITCGSVAKITTVGKDEESGNAGQMDYGRAF